MKFYWVGKEEKGEAYAAFRYGFRVEEEEIVLRIFGASWFTAYLDGEYLTEGPYRFDREHPQYEERRLKLSAGEHVLSAEVHGEGVDTRILQQMQPFFGAELLGRAGEIVTEKRALALDIAPSPRRINPELGWMENRDLSKIPDFRAPGFDDSGWSEPVEVFPELGTLSRVALSGIRRDRIDAKQIASGALSENYGYENDDIPVRFFLRDLLAEKNPANGTWMRFDLGKVRLFRFGARILAPRGGVLEIAYSEVLQTGRVSPWITLSGGTSCNLDRYRLKPGENIFGNLAPRGGRYAEVHLLGEDVRAEELVFYDRTYFGSPEGAFSCGEELIDRIWSVGVETFRSCAEDAVIDNPTRERGEWSGDVSGAGMDICAAAYSDLRLIRRGLEHSAWCASEDGCVAGLCPGGIGYISTYALQWTGACVRYYRMTGDKSLLEELFPFAERNVAYFRSHWTQRGVDRGVYWTFIDWGYVSNEGESDMGLNLHLHAALKAYREWAEILGKPDIARSAEEFLASTEEVIRAYLKSVQGDFHKLGMQRAALALGEGFFEGEDAAACVRYIEEHYLSCFPNDPSAPRLSAPDKDNPRLITPYFSHYAFSVLWERGEGDFVLGQYRSCWGWLAEQDNTWLEVFDDRWSHCHDWSGCPTWQLSRYVLGLRPRFDLGKNFFEFCAAPCSLPRAEGRIPVAGGGAVEVLRDGVRVTFRPGTAVTILKDSQRFALQPGESLEFEI